MCHGLRGHTFNVVIGLRCVDDQQPGSVKLAVDGLRPTRLDLEKGVYQGEGDEKVVELERMRHLFTVEKWWPAINVLCLAMECSTSCWFATTFPRFLVDG